LLFLQCINFSVLFQNSEFEVKIGSVLPLLWDLDARNHEATLLRIKHLRLRERYGEGEIPHQSKTGTGPFLLTCSFPYVRDWLNEHPFQNELHAMAICNLKTGASVKPDALTSIMKQLRHRIILLLQNDYIYDNEERERLEFLELGIHLLAGDLRNQI
jgi:hypothetical protein